MMQAIAMSLAVEEEAHNSTTATTEGGDQKSEAAAEEKQEIEFVTDDKLWSLYDKILGVYYSVN